MTTELTKIPEYEISSYRCKGCETVTYNVQTQNARHWLWSKLSPRISYFKEGVKCEPFNSYYEIRTGLPSPSTPGELEELNADPKPSCVQFFIRQTGLMKLYADGRASGTVFPKGSGNPAQQMHEKNSVSHKKPSATTAPQPPLSSLNESDPILNADDSRERKSPSRKDETLSMSDKTLPMFKPSFSASITPQLEKMEQAPALQNGSKPVDSAKNETPSLPMETRSLSPFIVDKLKTEEPAAKKASQLPIGPQNGSKSPARALGLTPQAANKDDRKKTSAPAKGASQLRVPAVPTKFGAQPTSKPAAKTRPGPKPNPKKK